MRVRDLERTLASLTPWTATELDQRTRRLREARMLPVGGRGLNAPEIGAEHVATVLIALVPEKSVEAHLGVLSHAGLVPQGDSFIGERTFADALTAILENGQVAARVRSVRMCRSWPQASIAWVDAEGEERSVEYRASDAPKTGYGFLARSEVVFSTGLLTQLAFELVNPKTAGGWEGDESDPGPAIRAALKRAREKSND